MKNQPKNNLWETVIGPNVKVITDPRSKARTVSFPFDYPDGAQGVIIICRLEDGNWVPNEDIKSVIINFNED